MVMRGCRRRCEWHLFPKNILLQSRNPVRVAGKKEKSQHTERGDTTNGPGATRVEAGAAPGNACCCQHPAEDEIWTQFSHVDKKLLGPCLVLCCRHTMALKVFSENTVRQSAALTSWMSREPLAHKPPCQPYLALLSNLWQAQLVSTSVNF